MKLIDLDKQARILAERTGGDYQTLRQLLAISSKQMAGDCTALDSRGRPIPDPPVTYEELKEQAARE